MIITKMEMMLTMMKVVVAAVIVLVSIIVMVDVTSNMPLINDNKDNVDNDNHNDDKVGTCTNTFYYKNFVTQMPGAVTSVTGL